MSKPKILITRRWPEPCEARLRELFDTTLNIDDRALSPEQLREALRSHDAVLPTVTDTLPPGCWGPSPCAASSSATSGWASITSISGRLGT